VNLLLLAGAGVVAGAVNAAVGSGTLLTYPLLLASGLPPVVANGTNSLGVAPGGLSAAWVYRGELEGRKAQVRLMAITGCVGAVVGALLVIALPARVFEVVVPWLILSACVLVLVQPALQRWLRGRGIDPTSLPRRALIPVLLGIGVGAAQGVILMAALGTMYDTDLQRSNAVKNIVGGLSNVLAACVFALAGVVMWAPALALAVGATAGGLIGAPFARRLPEPVLRGLIVVVGLVAATVSIVRH
jgi:uncharacterized membrane protein YfcA